MRDGATTYWYLLDTDGRHGTGSSSDEARRAFPTLQAWLDDQVALQTGRPTLALVRFTADGRLTPLDGVTLVRQRTDVRPRQRLRRPRRHHRGGRGALARARRGSSPRGGCRAPHRSTSRTAASVSGPTLDDFLAYARARYSEHGAGLR